MPTRTITRTRTAASDRLAVAERVLAGERVRAPAAAANRARNARAEVGRHGRWAPAREAVWRVLDDELEDGATVAIVGAGNGDTVPLARIAARASRVALIDLDPDAIRAARADSQRGCAAGPRSSSTTSPPVARTRSRPPPLRANSWTQWLSPRRHSPARRTTS
jgi:hypothetical protein